MSWKLPKGYSDLEVFPSEGKKRIFKTTDSKFTSSDLSKEERQAMLSLADDRSIIIKKLAKVMSFVGIEMSFILEPEKKLQLFS